MADITSIIDSNTTINTDVTTTVVENDTTPSSGNVLADAVRRRPTARDLARLSLEKLEEGREEWERKELAAAHTRLYSLLTECYGFYLLMKTSPDTKVRKAMAEGLAEFIELRGYRFQSSTHDMTRVVKAVFGVERRRVSAYSIALRAALEAGTDAKGNPAPLGLDELAGWIGLNGGVEEIRLGCKNGGLSTKARAEAAAESLKGRVLDIVRLSSPEVKFSVDDNDKQCLLVATYRASGELEISAVVKNDSAVRAALAAVYVAEQEHIATKAAETKAADEAQAVEESIAQASAGATVTKA